MDVFTLLTYVGYTAMAVLFVYVSIVHRDRPSRDVDASAPAGSVSAARLRTHASLLHSKQRLTSRFGA